MRILGAPSDGRLRPALLRIHGGGYMMGTAHQDDSNCARYAERLGVTVVSVDSRLAPEHPFPAPLEDCFAAFELAWRHECNPLCRLWRQFKDRSKRGMQAR